MNTGQTAPRNIDDYIAGFPRDIQEILEKIRMTIRKAAPGAEEKISYQIPCFSLKGSYLIYFAAFKKHIGLYPAPRGIEELKSPAACCRESSILRVVRTHSNRSLTPQQTTGNRQI
jgi:uncharacterized protein YdhG (YjbR/CyaY superfamily)